MKKKELIEKLGQYPDHAPVKIITGNQFVGLMVRDSGYFTVTQKDNIAYIIISSNHLTRVVVE